LNPFEAAAAQLQLMVTYEGRYNNPAPRHQQHDNKQPFQLLLLLLLLHRHQQLMVTFEGRHNLPAPSNMTSQ
jgi:hypothetical protein